MGRDSSCGAPTEKDAGAVKGLIGQVKVKHVVTSEAAVAQIRIRGETHTLAQQKMVGR